MTSQPGLTTNYNTHYTQYLTKLKQQDNETWSVQKKNGNFFKNHAENLFCFLKKLYKR